MIPSNDARSLPLYVCSKCHMLSTYWIAADNVPRLDFAGGVKADDGEDDELMPEDSAADSFFVPDGQLSDDEGLSSAQQGVDDLCADQLGKPCSLPPDIRRNVIPNRLLSPPHTCAGSPWWHSGSFCLGCPSLLPGSQWMILMCCT